MKRAEFIRELEYLLQDIPEADREDAVAYYRDYLEEAGEEHEEEAIREFGSPERVAAMIRADLDGQMKDSGVFTDTGYQDERFRETRYQVMRQKDRQDTQDGNGTTAGRYGDGRGTRDFLPPRRTLAQVLRVILLLVLLFVAAPVMSGLGSGMLGIAAGIAGMVIVTVILVGLLTAAALIGAVVLMIVGFGTLVVEFWSGVMWIGLGIMMLGLGLLGLAASVLVYGKLIPWCLCGVVNIISRFLHRGRRSAV